MYLSIIRKALHHLGIFQFVSFPSFRWTTNVNRYCFSFIAAFIDNRVQQISQYNC